MGILYKGQFDNYCEITWKGYTGFRLLPKSVTLNNLERCKGRYFYRTR